MTQRNSWLLILALAPLIWAGNALVGRASVGVISPLALSFWRWVLALALLLPFTIRDIRAQWPLIRRNWWRLWLLGVFSVTIYNTFLYMAVETTTAINATLVGVSMPLMMLLLSRLWLGDAIRPRQLAGIIVSAVGLVVVVTRGDPSRLLQLGQSVGDGLMLLATLSWAVYSVMLKRFALPLRGNTLLCLLIMAGLVLLVPAYGVQLWLAAPTQWVMPSWPVLGAIVYTAVLASLLAYSVWNRGVAVLGAPTAGQYSYLIPVFTAILAIVLLGEQLQWFHGAGGILIFAGIALATIRGRR